MRPPHDEGLPVYLRVARGIEAAIVSGQLEVGSKVGSHRAVAAEMGIAPLTVKRAYDHLEARGLLKAHRGRGTFVAAVPPPAGEAEALERLRPLSRRLVREAELLGLPFGKLVDQLWNERLMSPSRAS
jgi:GntR family transcriptional regulator